MSEPIEQQAPVDLNTDSGETLTGIHQALEAFGGAIPDAGPAKVTFRITPDMTEWEIVANLQVLGEVTQNHTMVDGEVSTNFVATVIYEVNWRATGPGFAGVVEALADEVENFLRTSAAEYHTRAVRTQEAVHVLRNPDETPAVWRGDPAAQEAEMEAVAEEATPEPPARSFIITP